MDERLYIKRVHIAKVRHLSNIFIPLAENEMKHLILTGKNGSGKTCILDKINEALYQKATLKAISYAISHGSKQDFDNALPNKYGISITLNRRALDNNGQPTILKRLATKELVCFYFRANRVFNLSLPKAIEKVDLDKAVSGQSSAGADFIKYLLYLNYQRMFAISENRVSDADKIKKWFDRFTSVLREIYNCPKLELIHNSKDLTFRIKMPGREMFGLNEMADGYSAFLEIVMELIMRMEKKASLACDLPGIVLIDDIETNLHVELQRSILPFLTSMFPNIQFIVTTRSPFVITSMPGAAVFDLDNHEFLKDLPSLTFEEVVEVYFSSDIYTKKADEMLKQYKELIDKPERTRQESDRLAKASSYLDNIPANCAKKLTEAFREEQRKRASVDDNAEK